jgi:hypothetical protein
MNAEKILTLGFTLDFIIWFLGSGSYSIYMILEKSNRWIQFAVGFIAFLVLSIIWIKRYKNKLYVTSRNGILGMTIISLIGIILAILLSPMGIFFDNSKNWVFIFPGIVSIIGIYTLLVVGSFYLKNRGKEK